MFRLFFMQKVPFSFQNDNWLRHWFDTYKFQKINLKSYDYYILNLSVWVVRRSRFRIWGVALLAEVNLAPCCWLNSTQHGSVSKRKKSTTEGECEETDNSHKSQSVPVLYQLLCRINGRTDGEKHSCREFQMYSIFLFENLALGIFIFKTAFNMTIL